MGHWRDLVVVVSTSVQTMPDACRQVVPSQRRHAAGGV
jgi:hypothetical protein